jgi:hypothetical protein
MAEQNSLLKQPTPEGEWLSEEERSAMLSKSDDIRGLIAAAIILACCAILALFGCSQQPVAPSGNFLDPSVEPSDGPEGDEPAGADTVLVTSKYAEFQVDARGGSFDLKLESKEIRFEIPEGAVTDEVKITVTGTKYKIGKTELYIYDCGPDGLQFSVPIEIKQPVPSKLRNGEAILLYFDEKTDDGDGIGWESMGSAEILGSDAKLRIFHFSKYGISYTPDPTTNEEGNGNHHEH